VLPAQPRQELLHLLALYFLHLVRLW
jgi:hypothetical protein